MGLRTYDDHGMFVSRCPYEGNCEYDEKVCLSDRVELKSHFDCPFYQNSENLHTRAKREAEKSRKKKRPSFLDFL